MGLWPTIQINTSVKPLSMRRRTAGQSESLALVLMPGVSSSAPLAIERAGWLFTLRRGLRKIMHETSAARWTGAQVPDRRTRI